MTNKEKIREARELLREVFYTRKLTDFKEGRLLASISSLDDVLEEVPPPIGTTPNKSRKYRW